MRKHLLLIIVLLVAMFGKVYGQQQSGRVYEFLNLPHTARATALGGYAFPAMDDDLGNALMFPSLLSRDINQHLSLNVVDYFDDINYGTVAFSQYFEKLGQFSGSVQYVDYGSFIEADETGMQTGRFSAGDISLQIGWGRALSDRISLGANLKVIHSSLHSYSSTGFAIDVAADYKNPENLVAVALVARHIGRQLTHYHDGNRESLPFDLVVGVSKKLANAPFQFSIVANNLHNYDLTYDTPVLIPDHFNGDEEEEESLQQRVEKTGDQIMRHIVLGLEFTPVESLSLRMGYNYRRRQEMKVESYLSTVGFSFGVGVQISRFQVSYGRSNYHLAGSPNHISISTSLQDLFENNNNQAFPDNQRQ